VLNTYRDYVRYHWLTVAPVEEVASWLLYSFTPDRFVMVVRALQELAAATEALQPSQGAITVNSTKASLRK